MLLALLLVRRDRVDSGSESAWQTAGGRKKSHKLDAARSESKAFQRGGCTHAEQAGLAQ